MATWGKRAEPIYTVSSGVFNFNWDAKVQKGIAVFAVGEQATGDLPVDHVLSLRENPMVLITDQPKGITEKSSFHEHLEASLKIFSWNVVNLIVSVGDTHWTVYSFNMSYPMHRVDGDFIHDVLLTHPCGRLAPITCKSTASYELFVRSPNHTR